MTWRSIDNAPKTIPLLVVDTTYDMEVIEWSFDLLIWRTSTGTVIQPLIWWDEPLPEMPSYEEIERIR